MTEARYPAEQAQAGTLAGRFAGTFTGAWPPVGIHSLNDSAVAQSTTCFDMANLYAHIFQLTLVDIGSANGMLALLATTAAIGNDPSFLEVPS
jgi:hypothetical protein